MDKETVVKTIKDFIRAIELQSIRIQKVVLYGSYAMGNPHEGSDIDLVVISPDFQNLGYWERIEILSEAVFQVFAPIEAVAMTPTEWENRNSLIAEFAAAGEVVYAA